MKQAQQVTTSAAAAAIWTNLSLMPVALSFHAASILTHSLLTAVSVASLSTQSFQLSIKRELLTWRRRHDVIHDALWQVVMLQADTPQCLQVIGAPGLLQKQVHCYVTCTYIRFISNQQKLSLNRIHFMLRRLRTVKTLNCVTSLQIMCRTEKMETFICDLAHTIFILFYFLFLLFYFTILPNLF